MDNAKCVCSYKFTYSEQVSSSHIFIWIYRLWNKKEADQAMHGCVHNRSIVHSAILIFESLLFRQSLCHFWHDNVFIYLHINCCTLTSMQTTYLSIENVMQCHDVRCKIETNLLGTEYILHMNEAHHTIPILSSFCFVQYVTVL